MGSDCCPILDNFTNNYRGFECRENKETVRIELTSPSIKTKSRLLSSVFSPRTGASRIDRVHRMETPDGHLRHSKFVGLREDKEARAVARERF